METDQKEWATLWKIKVPSKLRIFLWRLARQSLPTGDVRHNRHMAQHRNCTICGQPDSWRHSLLECNLARCVWVLQGEEILNFVAQTQHEDGRGWIQEANTALNYEHFLRLVVTVWAIWYVRRKLIHEDLFQSPCRLMPSLSVSCPTWI